VTTAGAAAEQIELPFVIDASAVMAFIYDEPGGDSIQAVLSRSIITCVNFGEVLVKVSTRFKIDPATVESLLEASGLGVAVLDQATCRRFPSLSDIDRKSRMSRSSTNVRPLSLADLSCLAFATEHDLPVLTADRHWAELRNFGLRPDVFLIR
jgi:PIN domain nuclease of toxin-antitoxin system